MDVSRIVRDDDARGAFAPSRVGDRVKWPVVELGARQCSLVVLCDTEAHFLRPLLTVQPSFTMSY
jgi:hypothetical protein